MKEINIIRKQYNDIKFIFDFVDRFVEKMKNISVEEQTLDTVIFEDYYLNDIEKFIVPLDKVNKFLDYCYNEYFFKVVLSGSSFYQKVKKICDDFEIEVSVFDFDLFFRSLFLGIKVLYNSNDIKAQNIKDFFYKIVLNAHSDAFDSYPKINTEIEIESYKKKIEKILKKLERVGLISFESNDITGDLRLREYFPISCDTFKFHINKDKIDKNKFDIGIPMFDFLDLRLFLNNTNTNLLERMDRAVHVLILISFKGACFHNNANSDNSYIKKLRFDRSQLEKLNKKCVKFH